LNDKSERHDDTINLSSRRYLKRKGFFILPKNRAFNANATSFHIDKNDRFTSYY
jgi:hypothetical protein